MIFTFVNFCEKTKKYLFAINQQIIAYQIDSLLSTSTKNYPKNKYRFKIEASLSDVLHNNILFHGSQQRY